MPSPVPVLSSPAEWTSELVPAVDASVRSLLGPGGARLVIDLSGTSFLSSAALTFLIHLGKRLADGGGGLALARPAPAIVKLLRALGLTRVLRVFDGVEEARVCVAAIRPVSSRP
jgi:anti-anti-sigma factor